MHTYQNPSSECADLLCQLARVTVAFTLQLISVFSQHPLHFTKKKCLTFGWAVSIDMANPIGASRTSLCHCPAFSQELIIALKLMVFGRTFKCGIISRISRELCHWAHFSNEPYPGCDAIHHKNFEPSKYMRAKTETHSELSNIALLGLLALKS